MAQTPLSGSASYLTAARYWLYKDERPTLELLSDDDTRATRAAAEDETPVLAGQPQTPGLVFLAARQWASGEVERWCLPGERYLPVDLAALTGNGKTILEGLVADLAFWRLTIRRWPRTEQKDVSGAAEAMQTLKDLREGETIFGLAEAADAGLPSVATLDTGDNGQVVRAAHRYFGNRLNRDR